MSWYDKLNEYFPVEEMKSKQHVEALLAERSDVYRIDQGPNHVLLYVEGTDFTFVDYLLVTAGARGQGLGRTLLDRLKAIGKPILLEVEPASYEDTDTVKRHRFYEREGFRRAESFTYRRRSLATGEENDLEILYWSPDPSTSDADVYDHMRAIYEHVHTWRDREFYGESYQPADEVLRFADAPADSSTESSTDAPADSSTD
ncbi:GNAT family N-acetyltransferase [Rubrivirga sp. S365]|uniref:GNAT family N-acetyltransferase n=1 Tax=Rubrivirga litoralis TaxID=3075598 RepID=A0ABU3BRH1_9BACT|nr:MULTISPECIES: GNAT family N-acetyltransferase [unclassified Rubrivirga]MDT0631869.1 GNAT family N-acetyltransferase [Rubrivirga sp. F394]MDT7857922.1 GNAT family N-acetyltransferase [Rubrivirga sp. S365]